MAEKDKVLLLQNIEDTLKPRMFVNMFDEATQEIQEKLDDFDVEYVGNVQPESCDLLDAFINAKRASGRSEKTLVRYRYLIERFLKAESVSTRQINAEHIRHYFSTELARGIADRTIRGYRDVLNSFFGWLADNRLIRINPILMVEPIKCEEKERQSFSFADLDQIKRNVPRIRDIAIIYFLLSTGCRISEMVALNRQDLDLQEGECVVYGKGKKERTVFLTEEAVLVLREYLATRTDQLEPLFLNHCMKRLSAGGVRAMMKKLSEDTGVENIHPHRFRRTMITIMLNRGMPIQEVMILAGHSKADTTMKYYSCTKSRIKNSFRIHSV